MLKTLIKPKPFHIEYININEIRGVAKKAYYMLLNYVYSTVNHIALLAQWENKLAETMIENSKIKYNNDIKSLKKKNSKLKDGFMLKRSKKLFSCFDLVIDVFKFLERSEIAKSQLVCVKWNRCVKGNLKNYLKSKKNFSYAYQGTVTSNMLVYLFSFTDLYGMDRRLVEKLTC